MQVVGSTPDSIAQHRARRVPPPVAFGCPPACSVSHRRPGAQAASAPTRPPSSVCAPSSLPDSLRRRDRRPATVRYRRGRRTASLAVRQIGRRTSAARSSPHRRGLRTAVLGFPVLELRVPLRRPSGAPAGGPHRRGLRVVAFGLRMLLRRRSTGQANPIGRPRRVIPLDLARLRSRSVPAVRASTQGVSYSTDSTGQRGWKSLSTPGVYVRRDTAAEGPVAHRLPDSASVPSARPTTSSSRPCRRRCPTGTAGGKARFQPLPEIRPLRRCRC